MSFSDYFLSTLALDAYNRGYNSGISDSGLNDPDGLGELGAIGTVNILERPEEINIL